MDGFLYKCPKCEQILQLENLEPTFPCITKMFGDCSGTMYPVLDADHPADEWMLVRFQENYADEFDIEAYILLPKVIWGLQMFLIQNCWEAIATSQADHSSYLCTGPPDTPHPLYWGFGTNEEIWWGTFTQFAESFKFIEGLSQVDLFNLARNKVFSRPHDRKGKPSFVQQTINFPTTWLMWRVEETCPDLAEQALLARGELE